MPDNNNNPPEQEEVELFECPECSWSTQDEDDFSYSEYFGCSVCESCYNEGEERLEEQRREEEYDEDEENDIQPYSTRHRARFHYDDGKVSIYQPLDESLARPMLTMGYELEVEYEGHRNYSKYDGAAHLLDNFGRGDDHIYLKSDGSLNDGFEIVTQPGTLKFYQEHFDWEPIQGLAKMGFKAWNNSHCGLHIHMSRNAFVDDRHLFLYIKFIYGNRDGLVQFAGRESHYAKFGMDEFLNAWYDYDSNRRVRASKLIDIVKGRALNNDRYVAVNLQNTATIELRFFRPSLKATTVKAALEFCDASFRYVHQLSLPDVLSNNGLAWNSFRSWLNSKNDPSYTNLRERLVERCGALNADE